MLMKEEVPEDIHKLIISDVNDKGLIFNDMLLSCLSFLNEVIIIQSEEKGLLANLTIEYILTSEVVTTNLLEVFEVKSDSIKINDKLKDMLIINSKSILNAIGSIRNFQQDRLKEAEPEEILLALIK